MNRLIGTGKLLFCAVLLGSTVNAFSQIVMDDSPTAEEMAEALVGEGVTISGVELDCPDGAYGFFRMC
jgi:hypothetical protein